MNDTNAIGQIQLAIDISKARGRQLEAVELALMRLDCSEMTEHSRTFMAVAVYLAYLGLRLEKEISSEFAYALRDIERMQSLPDQAQWEYGCAKALGVCEALNRIGSIQAGIIEQAQTALQKAAILLIAESDQRALPVSDSDRQNFIESMILDLNPRQGKRLGSVNEQALVISQSYLKKAKNAQDDCEITIASTCRTTTDVIVARLAVNLSRYAGEAVRFGTYLNDPAPTSRTQEYDLARIIAAGLVSGLVTDLVRQCNPCLAINLN